MIEAHAEQSTAHKGACKPEKAHVPLDVFCGSQHYLAAKAPLRVVVVGNLDHEFNTRGRWKGGNAEMVSGPFRVFLAGRGAAGGQRFAVDEDFADRKRARCQQRKGFARIGRQLDPEAVGAAADGAEGVAARGCSLPGAGKLQEVRQRFGQRELFGIKQPPPNELPLSGKTGSTLFLEIPVRKIECAFMRKGML